MMAANAFPWVLGVYSLSQKSEIGSGATMLDRKNLTYWYVRQLGEDDCELQPLSSEGMPSGVVTRTILKEIIRRYTPEPFYYAEHPSPVLNALAARVLEGEGDTDPVSLPPKELACLKALLGGLKGFPPPSHPGYRQAVKTLSEEARRTLTMLLCRGESSQFEHRSRCSTHAVSLRKDKRFEASLEYLAKALLLEENDEHIYFNMARVYYDKGDLDLCARALHKALALNPRFAEARRFVAFLERTNSRLRD